MLHLITRKPMLYVANTADPTEENEYVDQVRGPPKKKGHRWWF